MHSQDISFCQRCGHRLAHKEIDKLVRPYCPSCGQIVFLDPKIAALVLVSVEGKLVMVKRAIEPALGQWSFPSVNKARGEVVEEAAIREVKEETGLDVRLRDFVGLYSQVNNPVVLAVYSAEVVGGVLKAGDEAQEVALLAVDQLPPLPFPHDDRIVQEWLALNMGREH